MGVVFDRGCGGLSWYCQDTYDCHHEGLSDDDLAACLAAAAIDCGTMPPPVTEDPDTLDAWNTYLDCYKSGCARSLSNCRINAQKSYLGCKQGKDSDLADCQREAASARADCDDAAEALSETGGTDDDITHAKAICFWKYRKALCECPGDNSCRDTLILADNTCDQTEMNRTAAEDGRDRRRQPLCSAGYLKAQRSCFEDFKSARDGIDSSAICECYDSLIDDPDGNDMPDSAADTCFADAFVSRANQLAAAENDNAACRNTACQTWTKPPGPAHTEGNAWDDADAVCWEAKRSCEADCAAYLENEVNDHDGEYDPCISDCNDAMETCQGSNHHPKGCHVCGGDFGTEPDDPFAGTEAEVPLS